MSLGVSIQSLDSLWIFKCNPRRQASGSDILRLFMDSFPEFAASAPSLATLILSEAHYWPVEPCSIILANG